MFLNQGHVLIFVGYPVKSGAIYESFPLADRFAVVWGGGYSTSW